MQINGSNLILTRIGEGDFLGETASSIETDTGFLIDSLPDNDIIIPLSTCPLNLLVSYHNFFDVTHKEATPFVLKSEHFPHPQNLSLQMLPNTNNRIIRLSWTLNTSKDTFCPHKILAFTESNDKRCEYTTQHNYYDFDSLELNKMYKLGVVVRSTQNKSFNIENFVNYSTYHEPRMICPEISELKVLGGLKVKHVPKIMAHIIDWNSCVRQFEKCLSHYKLIQNEKRNGRKYSQVIRSTWHLNNIIYDIRENSTYEYGISAVYKNEIETEIDQWVSISPVSVGMKECPCELKTYKEKRWKLTISLFHESESDPSTNPNNFILKSLTDEEVVNKTFQLNILKRAVIMREV
ncbi:hypothetical protein EWB00_002447 [Schistosoma japonicum]|nr:hypothetical protein KSF78_0004010 [Schistosoma japonicum]TNN14235.1 hypothetical protein EWB00_002447 [Schistosoma japonicum]